MKDEIEGIKKEHVEYMRGLYGDLISKGWKFDELKDEFLGPDGFNITEKQFSEIIANRG